MPNIDSEGRANRTQFVYHNFFVEDTRGNLAAEVSQIVQQGLWSPVNYSIISPDVFFFGGGVPETATVICATPHQRSNEFVGKQHPWKKVRLMEPDGRIYLPDDDAVPANVRSIFAKKLYTRELAKNGFRFIPPQDLKAIIKWGNEASMFRYACGEGLQQYLKGQAEELEAIAIMESYSSRIPMSMEILDPSFSRKEVIAGIVTSVTKLSLTEKSEEILQAIADLETGNIEGVNDYLAPFYRDMAHYLDGRENAINLDKEELSRRIKEMIDRVIKMKPSYFDTKKIKEEYLARIFSEISDRSI